MNFVVTLESLAVGLVGGLGGGAVLWKFATDTWLEKRKAEWNKELEAFKDSLAVQQKRLQVQLDSSLFVTRAHFEVELNAMREVHQCLAEVKLAFRALNPLSSSDEKHDEERPQLIETLRIATARYLAKFEEWGAFLDTSLYDSFERCYYGADEECKRLSSTVISDGDKVLIHRQFFDNYRAACQGIRDRLKNLAILPGT
jgi:molybdopterin converting factor small subunit